MNISNDFSRTLYVVPKPLSQYLIVRNEIKYLDLSYVSIYISQLKSQPIRH